MVSYKPAKVLRRINRSLSRKLVYAGNSLGAISRTDDRRAFAYTFIAIQFQLTFVSDLKCFFLSKGESTRFQQNAPYILTSFEQKLGEIAMGSKDVDWNVPTAIQRPEGVEGINDVETLLKSVDRVGECFEIMSSFMERDIPRLCGPY